VTGVQTCALPILFTSCFDQYGHHQVFKIILEKTAVHLLSCLQFLFFNAWSPLCACAFQVTGCSSCCVVLCVFFTWNTHAHKGDHTLKINNRSHDKRSTAVSSTIILTPDDDHIGRNMKWTLSKSWKIHDVQNFEKTFNKFYIKTCCTWDGGISNIWY
jgi:hypothetical protein